MILVCIKRTGCGKMTIYPKQKQFKKLFSFYDEVVAGLVSNGIEKVDAEYSVKHFLKVFADDPEGWRKELKEQECQK